MALKAAQLDDAKHGRDARATVTPLNPSTIRSQFPILSNPVHGKPLVYLDNGATTQKPLAVIDAERKFYETHNANIHRAVHHLSQAATRDYDRAREVVARFINARDPAEVLFTRGTTESINLVASSFGRAFVEPGDEIIVSAMEHHSNIVPWQIACQHTGATLKVIPVNEAGELRLDELARLLSSRTKLIAVTHLSNALGTINDIAAIVRLSHQVKAKVLVDGAQWVAHHPTDVRALDVDFYSFSGHKLFGPTGIGVLYGKRDLLEAMPPYQGGGDMIESVSFEKTTYAPLPNKFEAGTPNIAGAVGLAAAIEWVMSIGFAAIEAHESALVSYALKRLAEVPGLRVIGTAKERGSVISFVLDSPPVSTLDTGIFLDNDGIAVRTGHHCCQPLMERMGVPSTTRVSLALYNTLDDVDALVESLKRIVASARPAPRAAAPPVPGAPKAQGAPAAPVAIQFPAAAGTSPQSVADELAATFEFLEDDHQKHQQLLDFAQSLPSTFDVLKTLTPRLSGCMSQVYLVGRAVPGLPDRFEFVADADSEIVRGEIAMLQRLYSGQKARDILSFDIQSFFSRIGLEKFLTSQRRTGLSSMIARIHQLAKHQVGDHA